MEDCLNTTELKVDISKKMLLYSFFKRIFDIVFSMIGIIICFIPGIIVAIIISLDSEGPAIYEQERLGLNGKKFNIYKFRSMRMDAEINGAQWATENDCRCTKVGRIIRKYRIDEIPQLWNILKGDMSFVGPRPEREVFYEKFEKYIPGFKQRLSVMPGLTGHAQVNGGYDLAPEEKIVYDMEYIENRSFIFDMKCILKTIIIVFSKDGAR